MPNSRHDHLGRRSSHSKRRHIIPFGHPYACTPILNAIFQINPSPSHSEVAQIIQQTGLKRKQITSWFWRKRKELIEHDQQNLVSEFHRSNDQNHSEPESWHARTSSDEQDEEYHPPSYLHTKQTSIHHHLNPTPSTLKPNPQHRLDTYLPLRDTQNLNHSNLSSSPLSPSSTPECQRQPLLVRCRLRPLAERVLHKTADREEDENKLSNKSQSTTGSPTGLNPSPGHPSSLETCMGSQTENDPHPTSAQPFDPPSCSSAIKQSGTPTWLRSDRRFSYPGNGQLESISRNSSNAFREPSSDSTDSSYTRMELDHGICFRVSQDDLSSSSNPNWSSLGHEVHRWSELSDVDGASRYSSESIESRASRCTNVTIEDYSALLNASSSDRNMLASCTGREPELETSMNFRDDLGQKALTSRSISHPYYPLDQTSRAISGFEQHNQFSFASSACLVNHRDSEVEEDPRLFMVQGDQQEFFDLLDWSPLGNFPSHPSS